MINKVNDCVGKLWKSEDAVGVVEIILILVVLIGLVIIFQKNMKDIVTNIFSKITKGTSKITI